MMKGRIRRTRRRNHSTAGFTLLELIVVLIIISVLFAIAAPSWDALLNRQRSNTIREQATQVLRQAQADARRSRTPRVVVFDNATGIPRAAVVAPQPSTSGQITDTVDPAAVEQSWQNLGGGEVKSNVVEFFVEPSNRLVFDSSGAIAQVSVTNAGAINTAKPRIFAIKVRPRNAAPQADRCVVVSTLLGGIRQAEGDQCQF